MGMMKVLPEIPALKASYSTGRVLRLPVNITVSVSYRCNSRCKTCNVWLLPNDDLTVSEWDRVYASLGTAPYWFTFSGGEPTLRKDLPDMVASAYRHCRPGIINIPTNGIQYKKIPGRIEGVLQAAPKSEVIINLSLDGVGLKHDEVRGVRNNWTHAMSTYAALKELKRRYKNLTLGIHTVISTFNVDSFPELCEYVQRELKPDSYITEIAEERVELDTVGLGITPTVEKYTVAIDTLLESMRDQRLTGVAEVTQAFRREYYEIVKRTLREQRQVIPAWRGWPLRRSLPTETCGPAAFERSPWATCATTTMTSARSGERGRPTSCGAASRPANATARWPTPPIRTCSRTRRR